MPPASSRSAVSLLVSQLDAAYDHVSWHGTNLRGSLRRVTPTQAAWRPAPARHTIWEALVHCAYWKYAVWRRLAGEQRGSFPLKGSNWFARPADGENWAADLALLTEMHGRLRAAVADVRPQELDEIPAGGSKTRLHLISGIIAHDLYHAGQIQLLKRLSPPR